MRLSLKSLLVLGATLTVALTGVFGTAGVLLIEDYKAIEADQAEADGARAVDAVEDDLRELEASAMELRDLADVLFTANGSTSSAGTPEQQARLFASLFAGNDVDAVVARVDGVVYAFGFDGGFGDAPDALNASVQSAGLLDGAPPQVLDTPIGAYLVAAAPLSAFGANGTLTVARHADASYAAQLGLHMGATVHVLSVRDAPGEFHIERHDWDHMSILQPIAAADGEPAMVLQVDQPRTLFRGGIDSITYFFWASFAILAMLLVAGAVVMRVFVTGRVGELGRRMRALRDGALDQRVPVRGNDEVTRLAEDFNRLLEKVESRTADLQRTNEDLDGFARVVSHDLKSPLSTFSLNLRMLDDQARRDGDDAARGRIERMERAVESMSSRIDAILAYSRHRDRDPVLEPVDLGPLVDDVLDDLEAEIERTGATVEIGPMAWVRADAEQVKQVLQNLFSNALKFGKEGMPPKVRVTAGRQGSTWHIRVEDDGIGFSAAEAERLFRPFERLDAATGRDGHGIGLATCARIMERHGGELKAAGRPGGGARFTIVLPDGYPQAQEGDPWIVVGDDAWHGGTGAVEHADRLGRTRPPRPAARPARRAPPPRASATPSTPPQDPPAHRPNVEARRPVGPGHGQDGGATDRAR